MRINRSINTLALAISVALGFHGSVSADVETGTPGSKDAGSEERAPRPERPKVPWIGLAARSIEPVERTQLKLPEGFGLVVEFVFPDGPGARVGIKRHDILLKFDDQHLINPPQLKALVCSKKKGDQVKLAILRSGKEIEADVVLGENEVPKFSVRMIRPPDGGEPIPVPADTPEGMYVSKLKELFEGKLGKLPGLHEKHFDFANSSASLSDTTGTYTLTKNGDALTLKAVKDGTVTFEGPVVSEQQRSSLPDGIREKLEALEAMTGRAKELVEIKPPVPEGSKK